MAVDLAQEARRKKAESDLLDGTDDDTADDTNTEESLESEASGDSEGTEEQPSEKPIYQPKSKQGPSYVLVPAGQTSKAAAAPDTSGHIDLGPPKAPEATTYPTIAEDQPEGLPKAPADAAPAVIPTPTPEYAGIDEVAPAPDRLPQVERGALVKPPPSEYVGIDEIAPAPDKLDQVERATLVQLPKGQPATMPWHPATAAPDTLTQVERGQLVSTPPGTAPKAVGVAAPVTYPTIAEDQGAPGAPPKVQAAQPVTPAIPSPEAQPAAPRLRASQFGLTPDEYKASLTEQPATTTQATALPDASGLNINTDYTAQKGSYAPGRAGKIQGIILHSSDGREKGDLNTLTSGGVSAHYYVTTDGRIYNLVNDGDTAYHAGKVVGPYNNSNTIGIEQEHFDPGGKGGKDGEAWSPAQVAATARLTAYLKQKYGLSDNQIMGHSDVAPERKQDPYNYPWQGFFSAVDKQGGAAPATGAPGTAATAPAGATTAPGGTQGYISGKATTFGYKDPDDSGVGAPKLGGLSTDNTDLIGIAVPQAALQSYVSAHPADWRKARVDVVGQNGQHVLVPIVDLGPRDTSGAVAADFTQGLTNLTGNTGDQNYQFKIIPNAGPDVMKNPQAFADEQAAIRAGIDTGARIRPQAPVAKKASYVLAPLKQSPAESIAAQTAAQYNQQGQVDTLDNLNRNTENPGQFWKMLQQPIPGTVGPGGQPIGAVSDATRAAYADNFKQELTKYAQDFYGEKDPDKAFQRAVGDANLGTFGQDVGRSFAGTIGQADLGLNQMSKNSDLNQLDRFAQILHPESDGPGRAAFIKTITDIKDPALQSQTIGALWANLDPQKQAAVDINGLVQSAQNVSSPEFQAEQQRSIDRKSAWVQKQFEPDPTLKGTPGQFWSGQTGQLLANTALAFTAPAIRTSAFAAQIYSSAQERLKSEHPDWTDQQLSDESSKSTFLQLAPQEALVAASHGILAPILKWAENPVARFGIGGGVHLATGAAGGAIMQAGANVAEGQPIGQGVGEAAISGAVQAAPFAIHGAIHGALTPPEAPTKAPLGQEPVMPPPETGPAGGAVRGAEPGTMATGGEETPVTPRTEAQTQIPQSVEPTSEPVLPHEPVQSPPEAAATVSPTEAAPPMLPRPPSVGEAEPWVSKIANRFTAERMATGELGAVEPGVGVSKEEMIARGLKMSPEEINQHVSNIMNDVGGNPRDQAAAIRAEEARLTQVSRQASLASEADPANQQLRIQADEAFKYLTDFHNGPVAKLKNNWHAQGKTLQGEIPVDLSTYNGLRDAYLKNVGKSPPASAEPVMRRTAKRVRDASTAEAEAMRNLGAEIEKQSSLRRLPTPDQVQENIMKRMKVEPCPT